MDKDESLLALSPLDGRYAKITSPLRNYFSEAALINYRLNIELKYLTALSEIGLAPKFKPIPKFNFNRVKEIERKTHHDVKAIEYYLREILPENVIPLIHFALTSEDTNNLAYRLMIQEAHSAVMFPILKSLILNLKSLIQENASLPMLARTHGQPAVPTTLGKELAVFTNRFLDNFPNPKLAGKLNGAIGNYQAHQVAYPNIDWLAFSDNFIQSLHLTPNQVTTQINDYDDIVSLLQQYHLTHSILIGLCQDIWHYISDDWLIQKGKTNDVGSSTMPQKINPIEFENAEGNLIMANGLIETIVRKLPISRLQHDLSESTIRRNLGVIFGHSLVAYHSLTRGLQTLAPNIPKINHDLNANYAILGEALQTVLRKTGKPDAYEFVAKQFKEKVLTQSDWQKLVKDIAPELVDLTPNTYLGYAEKLALSVVDKINQYCKGK